MNVTPGGNPTCPDCGRWYGIGVEHECAPDALPAERLAEIRAHSDAGSAVWPDPIGDARYLLAEVERLTRERDHWRKVAAQRGDDHTEQAEKYIDLLAKALEYRSRTEAAEAEVATLRATLQRIEDLADEWVRLGEVDVENQREHWAAADRLTMLLEGGDR